MTEGPYTLYTAGYQGRTPAGLLAALDGIAPAGTALLVDVRIHSWSPAPQWRGSALQALVGGRERYRWVAAFGNRNYQQDGGPIVLDAPGRGLRLLWPWLEARRPLVLLCACREWQSCHRTEVAEYIRAAVPPAWDLDVVHLEPPARRRSA